MKLITVISILGVSLISLNANFVRTQNVENDFNSDDTVSVEALNDEQEATTVSYDDDANTTPVFTSASGRQTRQEGEDSTCVTNTGRSGMCSSVKDCFPRLFPLDNVGNDTPQGTGVYNQNLAKLLIENSGFCGGSEGLRSVPDALSKFESASICCASTKASGGAFPLDNDTSTTIDEEYLKKPCGHLKVDVKLLPTVEEEKEKIVGGRPAVLGEFPWMVAMLRRGQQFCGASLLDSKNILTAAHCVEFMTKNDVAALRLHIGDLDIYSTKETKHETRRAKRVLYHKGFTMKNLEHDIALIHLDKPVEFSNTIQPVCLHPGNPPYDTGNSKADVTGWGTTSSGGSQSSSLLAVHIDVITQDECNKRYAKAGKKITAGMVCAGSKGKDSCQGDSGGPLVTDARGQGKQIGIVSWGIGCASYPGVYTRVDRYLKWINKNKQ